MPLTAEERRRITFSDPAAGYAELAEAVEAWGFRLMQGLAELLDRREVAEAWFEDEFVPVVESLREADLIGSGNRGRRLHPRRPRPLHAAPHPRVGRRASSTASAKRSTERPAPRPPG